MPLKGDKGVEGVQGEDGRPGESGLIGEMGPRGFTGLSKKHQLVFKNKDFLNSLISHRSQRFPRYEYKF